MIANILNIKVDTLANEEGPALGGAMLAAVANGEYKSVAQAAEAIVQVTDTVEPDAKLAELYEQRYRTFREIYPVLRETFSKM